MSSIPASVDPTPEQMRDELLKQLYANRAELKGIALVQGIKALAQLVPPAPPETADDGATFDLIEQLPALPKSEGQRLLREHIARLRAEVARYEDALVATADEGGD